VIVGLALLLAPALDIFRDGLEAGGHIDRCFDDYDPKYIQDPVRRPEYCDHPYWDANFFMTG
jgi:hypothetical protein